MFRSLFNRRERRRRPRSRAAGCLLWIVLLIVILIVLSVLFGGFQKGTKAGSLGQFLSGRSTITGMAGDFCRVAAQRLDPAESGLRTSGPHGATALRVLRTYAA